MSDGTDRLTTFGYQKRRHFIGGSDARIIMSDDEAALVRLWREKRGEVEPEDLSGNLVVQLGVATEKLNQRWYQTNTGQVLLFQQTLVCVHHARLSKAAPRTGRRDAAGRILGRTSLLPPGINLLRKMSALPAESGRVRADKLRRGKSCLSDHLVGARAVWAVAR
jgi:YqaJ-like viral recombinase domain